MSTEPLGYIVVSRIGPTNRQHIHRTAEEAQGVADDADGFAPGLAPHQVCDIIPHQET